MNYSNPTSPNADCPLAERIETLGWAVVATSIDPALLDRVNSELSGSEADRRGGIRNLLEFSAGARTLGQHPEVRRVAQEVLGPHCFITRALWFDKTSASNWKVPFHQDLAVAVREQRAAPGFAAWSIKAGVVHVQPPVEILERMLAVRVHLDACGAEQGPVRVLPGSHRGGRLMADDIEAWKARVEAVECVAPRGGVLAFRPLILHASSAARQPAHRRVIHFEFAAENLPHGIEWQWRF